MKITIISDTHMRHDELGVLRGDVLIHCGDMLNLFSSRTGHLAEFDKWLGAQEFDLILCIGGNHDLELERSRTNSPQPLSNAVYLEDDAYSFGGKTFYGAPWVPYLRQHAFFHDERELQEKWTRIPNDTDVLITHTPPADILDKSSRGMMLGCPNLLEAVTNIRPTLHCFGHVHASAGVRQGPDTIFVNASSVKTDNAPINPPAVFEI